jgi:8-oxo-dGTP pyrophosphatase MutT (NUDIX family)
MPEVVPTYSLTLDIEIPITNMVRENKQTGHVMIAIADHEGRIIVRGKASLYPPGITRIVGGGVDEGETPEQAAVREIEEELGIVLSEEHLVLLAIVEITGVTAETAYPLTEYLFYARMLPGQHIKVENDRATNEAIRLDELPGLVARYRAIDPALRSTEWDRYPYRWHDYGAIYGFVHEIVYEEIRKRGLQ